MENFFNVEITQYMGGKTYTIAVYQVDIGGNLEHKFSSSLIHENISSMIMPVIPTKAISILGPTLMK